MRTSSLKAQLASVLVLACFAALAAPITAVAVPYGSGVSQSDNTVSFVLNQNAASVEVLRDGANPVYPGTTAGLLSFDMAGYSTFQIKVTGNEAPGWTQYVADQTSTSFYVPVGVSVNKIPSSPDFGKVYISNATTGTTAFGRSNPEGIYMLRADGQDVGKGAAAGVTWGGGSGPWKSTIGRDGHVYVTDLSNDLAYEFDGNITAGTQLITAGNRTTNQWVGGIHVEGTQAGGDRKIYLVNVNYNDTARKGLIAYDLGGNATATAGDTGTQVVGPAYFTFYPYDVARDSHGDWYLNQYRSDPTQAPAITKFDGSGTLPLGDTPSEVLWETPKVAPYNGAYAIDINENAGLVAYGNYYTGEVNFFDMATGAFVESFDAGTRMREVAFDAAGNLLTVDNMTEWARFWSPGGYTVATTGWDGTQWTFAVVPEPSSLSLLAFGGLALLLGRGLAFLRRRRS